MPIIEPAIRPPSEALSFLLQVTLGCSTNSCTFCGAYKTKPFKIKPIEEIEYDLSQGIKYYPNTRKVFLMDGNALVLSNSKLIPILQKINQSFPKLSRISSYSNGDDLIKKSLQELEELRNNKLSLIYMGLESGSQRILDLCKKQSTVNQMVEGVKKAKIAKIKLSVILLLGLGGKELSKLHIEKSGEAINKMQPEFLSFLTLMLIPGTALYKKAKQGNFTELNPQEFLFETKDILKGLNLQKTIFRSNHASNYFALEGRLPQDKEKLIAQIESAIEGQESLRPEFLRGL